MTSAQADPNRDHKGRFVPGNKASAGVSKGKGQKAQMAKKAKAAAIELMEDHIGEDELVAIIRAAVQEAIEGDRWAREWIWDYLAGRPIKRVQQMGDEQSPLQDLMKDLAGENGNAGE